MFTNYVGQRTHPRWVFTLYWSTSQRSHDTARISLCTTLSPSPEKATATALVNYSLSAAFMIRTIMNSFLLFNQINSASWHFRAGRLIVRLRFFVVIARAPLHVAVSLWPTHRWAFSFVSLSGRDFHRNKHSRWKGKEVRAAMAKFVGKSTLANKSKMNRSTSVDRGVSVRSSCLSAQSVGRRERCQLVVRDVFVFASSCLL